MPLHFDIELDPLTYVVDVRRENTGFNCYPRDIGGIYPQQRLYRTSGGNWIFQATSRIGTQAMMDWRGPVDSDGTRPVLYYAGLDSRYGRVYTETGGGGYGRSIYRAGALYALIPNTHQQIWSAAIYRDPDTLARKLRVFCWKGSGTPFAVYQRTDGASQTQSTNYPTEPDAWQLLGSFSYSDLIGSESPNNRHSFTHWNESGTALVGMIGIGCAGENEGNYECSDINKVAGCLDHKALFRVDISGLAGTAVATPLGNQGRLHRQWVETSEYNETLPDPVVFCGAQRLVTHLDWEKTRDIAAAFTDGNIVAADWKGDTLVYARLTPLAGGYSLSESYSVDRPTCDPYTAAAYAYSESGSYSLFELSGFAETIILGAFNDSGRGINDTTILIEGANGLCTNNETSRSLISRSAAKVAWADLRYGAILWEDRVQTTTSDCESETTQTVTAISVKLTTDSGTRTVYESTSTSTTSYYCVGVGEAWSGVPYSSGPNATTDYYTCLGWPSLCLRTGTTINPYYSGDIDDSSKFPFLSFALPGGTYYNQVGSTDAAGLYGLGSQPRFTKIKWVGR